MPPDTPPASAPTQQERFQAVVDQALLISAFAALAAAVVVSLFVSRRIVEPLQGLDQRLRIAQRRQPAAKPAKLVVESLRAAIEYTRPKRERGPGTTDTFPGFMDPRMPRLAFLGQERLRLQQLSAGERHQTRPDGRVFVERHAGNHSGRAAWH